jgi:hypothetical protein
MVLRVTSSIQFGDNKKDSSKQTPPQAFEISFEMFVQHLCWMFGSSCDTCDVIHKQMV